MLCDTTTGKTNVTSGGVTSVLESTGGSGVPGVVVSLAATNHIEVTIPTFEFVNICYIFYTR